MAITAQAREIENSLAENAGAIGEIGQSKTPYLQDADSYMFTTSQPLCMNTLPRTTGMGVPVAESTPMPQMGPQLLDLFLCLEHMTF